MAMMSEKCARCSEEEPKVECSDCLSSKRKGKWKWSVFFLCEQNQFAFSIWRFVSRILQLFSIVLIDNKVNNSFVKI